MTRDHADLDTLISPLAARGAPAGFAARLSDRYALALAARRRRVALTICAASFASLAAIVVAGAAVLQTQAVPLHDWLTAAVSVIAAVIGVTAHALVHPLVHDFPAIAAGIVALAAITAGCCVALAAIVRGAPASSHAH